MKLTIAIAIAAGVYSITARVINAPKLSSDLANGALDTSDTTISLAIRELDDSRASTAFWDDDLASDADFSRYANKGGALMCGLEGSDETAGRQMSDTRNPPSAVSQFRGDLRQELQNWYWRNVDPSTYGCKLSEHWEFPRVMQTLGLSGEPVSEGGDNQCYRVEHWDPERRENGNQVPAINQWYNGPGIERQYRATKAHYEFGINTKGGAIYGLFLESPQASARTVWFGGSKDANKEDLPQLRAFSDIVWGFWNRDNPNIKDIRYFFMIGISNDATNQVIARCLKNVDKALSEWPGAEFSTATDEGHALLGSPNGAAFAYFLMQHKAELGQKTITKVTVFRPENDDPSDFVDASLLFHVGDGPVSASDGVVVADAVEESNHIIGKSLVKISEKNIIRVHELREDMIG